MSRRIGDTVIFETPISVIAEAAVVGKKEHDGPLGACFDEYYEDDLCGQSTFEKAESFLQQAALNKALENAHFEQNNLDAVFGGDLENQCTASHYAMRSFAVPYIGMYGACSNMALTLGTASLALEAGGIRRAAAVTSSHFCSAERQFRFPLEYGSQRTPSAQWTVTGAGCALLSQSGFGPRITAVTFGRIIDYGITDIGNMGAAMAPAAADTLKRHFHDTKTKPENYDRILTGDLGFIGSELLKDLLDHEDLTLGGEYDDCGCLIFDRDAQDVHAGGSGCGCGASVLCGKVLSELRKGKIHRVLFCATGALMSPTTVYQGESIPAIAHAVEITA